MRATRTLSQRNRPGTKPTSPARLTCLLIAGLSVPAFHQAEAQLSLSTAVDLALTNNPRVKAAESDSAKAAAALAATHDIYVPSLNAGAGLGESYGYSPNPPTLFTFSAQSLVYNAAQFSYIRSAHSGLEASNLALQDVREAVAEDAALTFVALDHDQQREAVLRQQAEYSMKLVSIVLARVDAGKDTAIDLTQARLTGAQFRLALHRAQDDTENDRTHLQRIMGVPVTTVTAEGGFPTTPLPTDSNSLPGGAPNAGVAAAFFTARAKQQQAFGDARFLYRPQFSLIVEYNRYATFTNSFQQLQSNNKNAINANEEVIGVQITLPLFDRYRKDKARESAADARHSLHEAENAQITVLDAQTKLNHTILELQDRAEVASLEQQLAQQQLDVLQLQLNSTTPGAAPQMTPKDEQNSRISEREKYLGVIDTSFQLHQAEISLMRQTGRLEQWLRRSSLTTSPAPSSPLQPNP
ncbi:TolC family protein [Granulicella tundricola]|uniref:Outer membrane efflux protein n=1 Tax=Granulicella tundricola (strain ATCC BAA-1859 / DSM 23138 / MP5ACTX9) TaxID=1198114 RepID=E8WY73_GRATM|nr:TolC family protein [Granulicella tundricola]ADW68700.1 outer membrane efflux protein [Granulicella tundricola MP5ACTX9]